MDEPLWLSGAAIAASLAGLAPAEAMLGFAPEAGRALARVVTRLAETPSDARARARDDERLRAMSPASASPPGAHDRALGASWMAAALAALPRADRATLARALDAASLQDVARAASAGVDGTTAHVTLALAARGLGRMPDAGELGQLVRAAAGDERTTPRLANVARSLRARGRLVEAPAIADGADPPAGGAE